jgi:hypothetical protein
MGVLAESIVAYAQPLLNESDGSRDDMNRALSIAQLCWNLALLPEQKREESLEEMRHSLGMDDAEFEVFRQSVVLPMIRRHYEMFPNMPRRGFAGAPRTTLAPEAPRAATRRAQRYPGTGRNAPCPCHSGKKYKRCCGR